MQLLLSQGTRRAMAKTLKILAVFCRVSYVLQVIVYCGFFCHIREFPIC